MHELSICQALVRQLDRIVLDYPGKKIAVVHLQVGPLSGVVAELLSASFPVASVGTMSENATLNCIEHGVLVHCPDCEKNSEVAINNLICPICDNWQTELISGDELILERVELESVAAEEKINKIAILRTNC